MTVAAEEILNRFRKLLTEEQRELCQALLRELAPRSLHEGAFRV
jgi:hypothetical protein